MATENPSAHFRSGDLFWREITLGAAERPFIGQEVVMNLMEIEIEAGFVLFGPNKPSNHPFFPMLLVASLFDPS